MPTTAWNLPLDLLCCPACGASLGLHDAGLACVACEAAYPRVAGVPWLFPDPAMALGEWRARAHAFLGDVEAQAGRYRAALEGGVVRASTRSRLKLQAAACTDHVRRLRALLSPPVRTTDGPSRRTAGGPSCRLVSGGQSARYQVHSFGGFSGVQSASVLI